MDIDRRKRLGELLLDRGAIDEWKLKLGMLSAKRSGKYLGEALINGRLISENEWLEVLGAQLGVPFIELDGRGTTSLSDETAIELGNEMALAAMPSTVARRYGVFPLEVRPTDFTCELVIATADPNNPDLIDELSWLLQMEIRPVLATRRAISEAIFRFYGDDDDGESSRMPLPELVPDFRVFRPVAVA